MMSVFNVCYRGQLEIVMMLLLFYVIKSNQVLYIDVEVDSNDSLFVREGWKEGGDLEFEGDGCCKYCGWMLLKMVGVVFLGVVFGIVMEKLRGNSV